MKTVNILNMFPYQQLVVGLPYSHSQHKEKHRKQKQSERGFAADRASSLESNSLVHYGRYTLIWKRTRKGKTERCA